MTEQEPAKGTYFEVDLSYTTEAKMVLLGEDADDIRFILASEFKDIPDLKVLSIVPATDELVKEAKQRRAFEEAMYQKQKEQIN